MNREISNKINALISLTGRKVVIIRKMISGR